jgi:hypothetical protein
MTLSNTFIVNKVAPTKSKFFKNLVVGQRITVTMLVKTHTGASGGNGHYAPFVNVNGTDIYITDLCRMMEKGFDFVRVTEKEDPT